VVVKLAGHIVLTPFPYTDLTDTKLRPVMLLREAPGNHDDWLVCMVSSQLHQSVTGFDELIQPDDEDFGSSGLKMASVLRLSRLAVLHGSLMPGAIGIISTERLNRIRQRIAGWLVDGEAI
jgi:mRNA interferase MazF